MSIMRESFDLHESIISTLDMALNTYSWVGLLFLPNHIAGLEQALCIFYGSADFLLLRPTTY